MAWHVAYLSRVKQLPDLETLTKRLDEKSSKRRRQGKAKAASTTTAAGQPPQGGMDWRAMKAAMKSITAAAANAPAPKKRRKR